MLKLCLPLLAIAAVPTFLAGCANDPAVSPQHDAGQPPNDASQVTGAHLGALGAACRTATECASNFCADGVCCDSGCGQQCYACNLAGASGHCAAMNSGTDTNSSAVCVAPSACVLPAGSAVPSCKFVDGTACQSDADCMSGHCITYFVDSDGDGYGTSQEGHFCAALNASPPAGYAAYTGDCCDLDTGANPGFATSQFLEMPDACGSFDWNCDGQLEQERSCPNAVACGAACIANLGFFSVSLFTAACH